MTLDEAIKHCKEKAKELSDKAYEEWGKSMTEEEAYACNECAREHEQLAGWLKELKALKEAPKGDSISREALKEHKFLTPQVKVIGGRHNGKMREQIIQAYQKGWNDAIDAIIDNAPTVFDDKAYSDGYTQGTCDCEHAHERPQGEWARHDEWVSGEYVGGFYHINCPNKDGYYSKWETNFCPNCGADMRGGAEHE